MNPLLTVRRTDVKMNIRTKADSDSFDSKMEWVVVVSSSGGLKVGRNLIFSGFRIHLSGMIRVGRNLQFSGFRIHLSGMNQGWKESCLQLLSNSSLRHESG